MTERVPDNGGAYNRVSTVAPDGYPTDFSVAPVGAHVHVAAIAAVLNIVKPAGATGLLAQNTGTQAIRYTLDGTNPTAALGFQLKNTALDPVIIPCPGAAIEMIQEAAGAALDYQWVS